ncbi:Plant-specific TFIIB-related protein PTF2 [Linum grandiflorum]
MSCSSCGHRTLVRDEVTGSLTCDSCGTIQEFDGYEARGFCPQGPVGVNVRVGMTGMGDSLAYREKKIFEANKLIDEITYSLDLGDRSVDEIRSMINQITQGEYGGGEWFKVLIGACAYAYMRSQNKAMPISEVGQAIDCDVYELGRMVSRVVEHLELRLPEFDIVNSFQRVVFNLANKGRIDGDMVERIKKQGVFLIQCAIKWFLTTGRRPLPVVAAVFVLVAELNGIQDARIEDVAKDLLASAVTCQKRYKELLQKLVEVAQALPWGKNVTVKNVVKNAPLIIRYMELKSSTNKRGKGSGNFDSAVFDIGEIVSECLRNRFSYGAEEDDDDDGIGEDRRRIVEMGDEDVDKLQLSHECLSMAYEKFMGEGNGGMSSGGVASEREYRGIGVYASSSEWWNGKSPLSKKLVLKDIVEKDVGLETMPPSFVKGCKDIKRRRAKIKAAKQRLKRSGLALNGKKWSSRNVDLVDAVYNSKKRKRKEENIDWEDLIIEALLVHQVKEDEIEKGYYKALLGLHVFNSKATNKRVLTALGS